MPVEPHITILARTDDDAECVDIAGGSACLHTRRGDAKDENEDCVFAITMGDDEAVIGVADGAGGHAGAAQAASTIAEAIAHHVSLAWKEQTETRSAILRALDEANQAVMASRAGATVAIAEVRGRIVQPYHVGDAQVLAVGQRGRVRHQSVSHSPTGYAMQAGLIDERAAIHHDERHLITNAVGMESMSIEVGPTIDLHQRDTLLVSSDGVFDNLYISEVVDLIRTGPVTGAADRLMQATTARMTNPTGSAPCKPDDIGFVLFRPLPVRTG